MGADIPLSVLNICAFVWRRSRDGGLEVNEGDVLDDVEQMITAGMT
ncbi:MAG: hypothetical protein WCL46_10685 [Chlorobium sp.]|nr:hypothetical protein [Chlorobium sp.]